ncbi:hypothetical protein [Stenomitos frigidus]|uniref:Uncharacterized protein n=1 Tax=Stenomitos frigidus ULC18 TaxID=2107698 RepID=A0A2T1DW41_9CYAN|nr:hypothetical protein [Stenomitos frigidus]PSB24723.1 hypothetical protein C7B82_25255 [Stenomitos frigidus ULC18]
MSEADSPNEQADSPNEQAGSPAPTEPVELTVVLDSATSEMSRPGNHEGWQTVDFPGAMSVDAIPYHAAKSIEPSSTDGSNTSISQGIIHYSGAEIDPAAATFAVSAETPDEITLRQQLQNENAALRDRLAQIELDLVQQQIEWQLESTLTQSHTESAGTVSTAESAGTIQPSIAESTDERLNQLLQALERSRQTAQRQQILVETLTEQLESSQERIAQLERDCALTQQRHNEQVQQVLQAEGACRDLRLRLHRQQQQTLQFKAALEKCLEMPTAYGQQVMPDLAIDDNAATPETLASLLTPKNQPVKPWSSPQRAAHEAESDSAELPKPLFKLLNGLPGQGHESNELQGIDALAGEFDTPFVREDQGSRLPAPADPSALIDSDDPEFVTQLMQLIFPATAEQEVYTTTDAPPAEPLFDLSPLGKANATPPIPVSQQSEVVDGSTDCPFAPLQSSEAKGQQQDDPPSSAIDHNPLPAPSDDRSTDPLWDDLTALINPPQTVEQTTAIFVVETEASSGLLELPQASTDSAHDTVSSVLVEKHSVPAGSPKRPGIPPFFAATAVERSQLDDTAEPDSKADSTKKAIAAWTWRDRLATASTTPQSTEPDAPEKADQKPAKLFALNSVSRQAAVEQPSVSQATVSQAAVSVASHAERTPTSFSTIAPSPIVYPLRSTKKLASLAAVDLPTFPRR